VEKSIEKDFSTPLRCARNDTNKRIDYTQLVLPAYNVSPLLIYLTNCSYFAKIIIGRYPGNLTHIIENRACPRLDHERIKIKTEISANNGAWGSDFGRACIGIKKKS